MIGPDATGLADFMVRRAAGLVDGLVVNADRMRAEPRAHGRASSSARRCCWRWCARGWRARPAYELVQRNALARRGGRGRASATLLGADADIAARLDAAEIDRAFDLEHHLRHAGAIIDRALADDGDRAHEPQPDHRRSRAPRAARQDAGRDRLSRSSARSTRARSATATCATGSRTLDRHRPHQRLRRRARHDPLQGPGAEPDGGVLVRGDRRPRSPTTSSACPTRR